MLYFILYVSVYSVYIIFFYMSTLCSQWNFETLFIIYLLLLFIIFREGQLERRAVFYVCMC